MLSNANARTFKASFSPQKVEMETKKETCKKNHDCKNINIVDCCCQIVPDLYLNPADLWRIITIVLTFKCADVKYLVRKEHNPPSVSLKFTKAALLFAAPSAESHSWPPGTDAGGDILTYSQAEEVEK